jgi:alanine racemase
MSLPETVDPAVPGAVPDAAANGTAGRAELVVDLDALRHNVASLKQRCAPALMMTVVKADGYGHGMVEVARAAREAGADWLGVAVREEALALRAAGDTGPLLTWLAVPGEDYGPLVEAGVDVTAYSVPELEEIAAAARRLGIPARVQLKVDTGLTRGGALPGEDWHALVVAAAALEEAGAVRVTGVWSHLACSDEPDHPANDAQEQVFREACAVAEQVGLEPEVRHLANSAAALLRPGARFDLVRCGIASYGLSPAPEVAGAGDLGLRPVMSARARLALVKQVPGGTGVSYGHTFVTERPTCVGVVPVGYGDGVQRHGSSTAEVLVGGRRRPVLGRVCMDQLVVEVDPTDRAGDPVVLFGNGEDGAPTAQDWAEACGTISYEIVTRIGGRMRRRYVDTARSSTTTSSARPTTSSSSSTERETPQ